MTRCEIRRRTLEIVSNMLRTIRAVKCRLQISRLFVVRQLRPNIGQLSAAGAERLCGTHARMDTASSYGMM
jgi:hypothetical protein